jgi:DNA-binding CsgD family transcriptional regulator
MNRNELSKRETQVVNLLLEGKSNKQIAAILGISEGTVEFHLTSIYAKLGVGSRVEAIIHLGQPGLSLDDPKLTNTGETTGEKIVNLREIPGEIALGSGYDGKERFPSVKGDELVVKKNSFSRKNWVIIIFGMALVLIAAIVLFSFFSAPKSWKGYERECENSDESTGGQIIGRSAASGDLVLGQFGSINVEPWSAMAGDVIYKNITMPRVEQLYLRLRYSKNSPPSIPILVYLDDEKTPRASIFPENQKDWNRFSWTDPIFLGSVESGVHTITFSTIGQQYGVADLDKFVLSAGSP